MKDIRIESIKKNKALYDVVIRIDNEDYPFRISEDLLIESRFLSRRPLTQEEYVAFLSKLPYDSLLNESVQYLDKRMKSEKEMRERLKEKTTSITLIDKTIEALKKKRLLNDEMYKNSILNELIYVKKLGPIMILNELEAAGLDRSFDYPFDVKKENIEKLTISFDRKSRNDPKIVKIRKAKMYLLRKGYTESDISNYFRESFISSENDTRLLEKEKEKLEKKYDDPKRLKLELLKRGFKVED